MATYGNNLLPSIQTGARRSSISSVATPIPGVNLVGRAPLYVEGLERITRTGAGVWLPRLQDMPDDSAKGFGPDPTVSPKWGPVWIYGTDDIKVITDGRTSAERVAAAEDDLVRHEDRLIEYMMWSGKMPLLPSGEQDIPIRVSCGNDGTTEDMHSLAGDAHVVSNTALSIIEALEQIIAYANYTLKYDGDFIFHTPQYMWPYWKTSMVMDLDTGTGLYSVDGHKINFGSGYPTKGPGDTTIAPASGGWLIATGPVELSKGIVIPLPGDEVTGSIAGGLLTNYDESRAERLAMWRWDTTLVLAAKCTQKNT